MLTLQKATMMEDKDNYNFVGINNWIIEAILLFIVLFFMTIFNIRKKDMI